MTIQKYQQVIKDLARYEFGRGIYTRPSNSSQDIQVKDLQRRIAEHYPDLKSAKQALKEVQKGSHHDY
jgi:hypothetical protein